MASKCLPFPLEEVARSDRAELAARLEAATEDFRRGGAHQVIESVADFLPVLDELVPADTLDPKRKQG